MKTHNGYPFYQYYWFWYVDSSLLSYTNWMSGQPDNSAGYENANHMLYDQNGKWNDIADYQSSYGLCQYNPVDLTPTPSPTFAPTIFCPSGYTPVSGLSGCYKYQSTPMNWFEAEKSCNIAGGHLTSITSSSEDNGLYQYYVVALNYYDFWIGGNDISSDGRWSWIDGSSWSYTNWRTGEPSSYIYVELCVNGLQSSGYFGWADSSCAIEKPSLCKYAGGGLVSSPGRHIENSIFCFVNF